MTIMGFQHLHYFPLSFPFLVFFLGLLALVFVFIEVGILGYAYQRIGIDRRHITTLLVLSFLGSYINLPIAKLPPEHVHSAEIATFFGMRYVIPRVQEWPGTVLAVNVGGGLIPLLLSLYLMAKNRMYIRGLVGIAIMTALIHPMARPVPGVGIAVPTFIPPVAAALVGVVLARRSAAPLAYVAGSMGTLVGADLLNLGRIQGLGAPVASIGGAGTFDGIFMTGIVAVLLAGLAVGRSGLKRSEGGS
jgi:uncharacterized membrane protein